MPRREDPTRTPRGWLAVPAAIAIAVALAVWLSGRLPEGAVEPHWDHTRCARCGMLISEPGFAAQVQRADGALLHYDDPGCLLVHPEEERGSLADAHAVWFHHASEPRWLSLAEVGFVAVDHSPMDFGLAAVERAARQDAQGVEQVQAALQAHEGRSP